MTLRMRTSFAFGLLLLLTWATNAVAQTTYSGSATAATASRPNGQTYGQVSLPGPPLQFIDLNFGYLPYVDMNGTSAFDPALQYNAGYGPGCIGICFSPGVPPDVFEGDPTITWNSGFGQPVPGSGTGVQTSVSGAGSTSTSSCAVGYIGVPFGPYTGISPDPSIPNSTFMYQGFDAHASAGAACTPNGGTTTYNFHHDAEKIGAVDLINTYSPPQWFTTPICFALNSGLPGSFSNSPLPGVTTPQPNTICFNQVIDQHTDANSASITIAAAVLTDADGSTLMVCRTHADVGNCQPTPPPLQLACQAEGTGQVGVPFSSALVASGGTQPYSNYILLSGSLPPGLTLDINTGLISGTPSTAGNFTFTGQVTDNTGTTASTPASPACHILVQAPHLNVVKTPKGGTFAQGAQVSFSIVVSNDGTSTANNVILTDTLPTNGGMTWTSAQTTQGTCTVSNSVLGCQLGNLAAGGSVTVTVTSPQSTPGSACQLQPNPAAIATADNAPSAQDSGSLNCTPPPPHLNVVKTPKNGTFSMGSQVSFSIVVSNGGGSTATNVTLTDALPGNGGLVWQTASTTQGSCVNPIASNNLSCSLGNIAPGGSVTVTVTSTYSTPSSACQSQPNPAAIAKADGGLTAQDSGSQSCTPPPPQLKVVKTPDGGTFTAGSQISYKIVVSNPAAPGSQSAPNVTLTDALPGNGGLVWQTATSSQGNCTNPIVGNSLNCNLGTIPAGGSVTVTVYSTATTTIAMCQSQPNPAAIATSGNLQAQDSGSQSCNAGYATYTPGGWGAPPNGGNVANILYHNFSKVYPGGSVTIGGNKTAKFTSSVAIENYLPNGGTPGAFVTNYINPTDTSAKELASQTLALRLNVDFATAGLISKPTNLSTLKLTSTCSTKLVGDTVAQILSIANTAVGGGALPAGVSYSDLTNILSQINGNFDGGTTNHGCLQ